MELVSIIMPVYNVEKYLEEAILSVLNQTYKNFELLLVNDGSTDNSQIICEKYIDNKKVFLINKENGGLSSARNKGIKESKGDYLLFLDSDDVISKNMIEVLVRAIIEHDADVSVCKMTSNYEEMGKGSGKESVYTNKEAIRCIVEEKNFSTSAGAKIFKRKTFENTIFPEGRIYEDYATIYKALYKSKKICLIDKNYYYYRENPKSITHVSFSNKRLQYFDASKEVNEFLSKTFPELIKYGEMRDTRYAISFYKQMIDAKFVDKKTELFLRKIIKKNIFKYIFSKYSILSKGYGICIAVMPKLLNKGKE